MRTSVFLVAALAILGATRGVRAHAPVELLQIVSRDPKSVLLTTNRGLIFGDTTTRMFSLLCNAALDVGTSEPYRVAQLANGRLVVASSAGMRVSDDRGCSFRPATGLAALSTPAFVQHPVDRQRLFVTTYGNGAAGQSALLTSDDGGENWRTLYTVGDNDYLGSLLLVASEPAQLFLSAIVLGVGDEPYTYYVASSRDGGASWQKFALTLATDELDLTLLAANPARSDELLARATASEPGLGERLMWSTDGGRTWSSPMKLRVLSAAAFSADGATAYASGVEGLWRADDPARTFATTTPAKRISHLEVTAEALFVSGYYQGLEAGLDGVAQLAPGSASLSPWLHFNEVTTPVSCPALSRVDAQCAMLWHDWQIENPPPATVTDAGVATEDAAVPAMDAGAIGETPMAPDANDAATRRVSSGCALTDRPLDGSLASFCCVLIALLRRRTRARNGQVFGVNGGSKARRLVA